MVFVSIALAVVGAATALLLGNGSPPPRRRIPSWGCADTANGNGFGDGRQITNGRSSRTEIDVEKFMLRLTIIGCTRKRAGFSRKFRVQRKKTGGRLPHFTHKTKKIIFSLTTTKYLVSVNSLID